MDELLLKQIQRGGVQITNKQLARHILNEYRGSDKINHMITAASYYAVNNEEIQAKSRDFVDDEGTMRTNATLANTKLASAYLRIAVDQKIDYGLGKPFVLEIVDTAVSGLEEGEVPEERGNQLNEYRDSCLQWFNAERLEVLSRAVRDSKINSIGWIYPWIDEEKMLQIIDVEPEKTYPLWADVSHDELESVVRDFPVISYTENGIEEIQKVEFWNKDVVEKYIDVKGELYPDIEAENIINGEVTEEHMPGNMGQDGKGGSWGEVPFIPIKGNDDEIPLLFTVKSYIDAYDFLSSKSVDSLIDDIDAVLVMRGISPEMGSLAQARQIMKNSRVVSVQEHGDARFEKVNADITAIEQKLASLENVIRKTLVMVDIAESKFGLNPSGEALKALYQELDTDTNKTEKHFIKAIAFRFKRFFDKLLEFTGKGTFELWQTFEWDIKFDRDMLIHEAALIDNTVKLQGLVSQETLDGYNPAVIDHKTEQERREKEKESAMVGNDMFELGQDVTDAENTHIESRSMYKILSILDRARKGAITRGMAISLLKSLGMSSTEAEKTLNDNEETA